MHAAQVAGAPPSVGSSSLASIGSIANSRQAEPKTGSASSSEPALETSFDSQPSISQRLTSRRAPPESTRHAVLMREYCKSLGESSNWGGEPVTSGQAPA